MYLLLCTYCHTLELQLSCSYEIREDRSEELIEDPCCLLCRGRPQALVRTWIGGLVSHAAVMYTTRRASKAYHFPSLRCEL